MLLAEPAASLTDLALGVVTVVLARQVEHTPGVHRHWRTALWCFGIAALGGAVHHGLMARWPDVADWSWAIISVLVVLAVSYLLAATVHEVLGPGHARSFWALRSVGLIAYIIVAARGHAGPSAILACESLTMISILYLWGRAAREGHPRAMPVIVAMLASGAAAVTKALPEDLDPTSIYHVAQIPGMVLLARAITRPVDAGARGDGTWAGPVEHRSGIEAPRGP